LEAESDKLKMGMLSRSDHSTSIGKKRKIVIVIFARKLNGLTRTAQAAGQKRQLPGCFFAETPGSRSGTRSVDASADRACAACRRPRTKTSNFHIWYSTRDLIHSWCNYSLRQPQVTGLLTIQPVVFLASRCDGRDEALQ
jgi:hypothetical protein